MFRTLSLAFCLATFACSHPPASTSPAPVEKSAPHARGRVTGIVRGTPYSHMPSPLPEDNQPVDTIGPPLEGQTVVLRELVADDAAAGRIVGTATTDASGRFVIEAAPGVYFLCVTGSTEDYAIETTGKGGKNFLPDDHVNTFEIISIEAGKVVERELGVSQTWPV